MSRERSQTELGFRVGLTGSRLGSLLPRVPGLLLLSVLLAGTFWGRRDLSPPAPLAGLLLVLPLAYGLVLAWFLLESLLARRRLLPAACFACTLLVALMLWGGAWAGYSPVPTGTGIRVMTWNVARLGEYASYGRKEQAQEEALECVAGVFQQETPDALALMEISSLRLDALSRRLGLDCVQTDYFGTHSSSAGGLAACVSGSGGWKITRSKPLPLPPDWHYVFTELQKGERRVNFLAVHFKPFGLSVGDLKEGMAELSHGRWARLLSLAAGLERTAKSQGQQVQELLEIIDSFQDPTVIAGDFNGTRDGAVHVSLRRQMRDAWESAAWGAGATRYLDGWLPLRVDYIYVSRQHFLVNSARLRDEGCSDHKAVLADLSLCPAEQSSH